SPRPPPQPCPPASVILASPDDQVTTIPSTQFVPGRPSQQHSLAAASALFPGERRQHEPPAKPASERGCRRSRPASAGPRRCFPGERSALRRSVSSARREGSVYSGPELAS